MLSKGILRSLVYVVLCSISFLLITQQEVMANAQQTTLYGTVYLGADPIPGAVIIVRDQLSKKEWLRKSTDAFGYYQFRMPVGLHQLEIDVPARYQVPNHFFQNVRVTSVAEQYHFVLRSSKYRLRGRIMAENGDPMTRVDVMIADNEDPNRLIRTRSDNNGYYHIDLSTGTYALSIEGEAGEYFPRNWNARSIVTDLRIDDDRTQDILLDKSKLSWALPNKVATPPVSTSTKRIPPLLVSYTGILSLSNGVGVADVAVILRDSMGVSVAQVVSTQKGGFSLQVPTGTYSLDLRATRATNKLGLPTFWAISGIRQQLFLDKEYIDNIRLPTVSVAGVLYNDKRKLVAGAKLRIQQHWRTDDDRVFHIDTSVPYTTDNQGSYQLTLFSYNNYTIEILPPAGKYAVKDTVTNVNASVDKNFDISLSPVYIITGQFGKKNIGHKKKEPTDQSKVAVFRVIAKDKNTGEIRATTQATIGDIYVLSVVKGVYDLFAFPLDRELSDNQAFETKPADMQDLVLPRKLMLPPIKPTTPLVSNLRVSEDIVRDLDNLPFYLSVRLIDSNRLPIQNVRVIIEDRVLHNSNPGTADRVTELNRQINLVSGSDGMIKAKLLAGHTYQLRVIPSEHSGFSPHEIAIARVSQNITTQVVLIQKDSIVPVLTAGPNIQVLGDNSVMVEWQTNIPTTGTLRYGLRGIIVYSASSKSKTVNHSVVLNKLIPDSHYEIRLKIADLQGNAGSTRYKASFKSGYTHKIKVLRLKHLPVATDLGFGRMKIEWTTERNLSALIEFRLNRDKGRGDSVRKSKSTPNSTRHSVVLDNLQPAMSYQYRIVTSDISGGRLSHLYYFNTKMPTNTQDIRIIEGPNVTDITQNSGLLHWRTNIPVRSSISIRSSAMRDNTLRGNEIHRMINSPLVNTVHKVYVDGLQANTAYEYVVAAMEDDRGKLSRISSKLKRFVTLSAGHHPQSSIIKGPFVTASSSRAILHWTSDYPTASILYYGPSAQHLRHYVYTKKYTREHAVELTRLASGRKYYYKIVSKWQANVIARANRDSYFVTRKIKDKIPPKIIVPPKIRYESRDSVVLVWQTNKLSHAEVILSDQGSNRQIFRSTDMNTQHELLVPGLQTGIAYTLQVRNIDLSGNSTQLTTPEPLLLVAGTELAPPVINHWQVKKLSDSRVKILWQTDKLSSAVLRYNLDGKFGSQIKRSDFLAYNHFAILSDLKAGTRYEFFIVSTDLDGQRSVASKNMRFTTTFHKDNKAPNFVVTPMAYDVLDKSALLTWQTDDFASAIIDYGISKQKFENQQKIIEFEQRHSWLMTGLEEGTQYYYRVTSIDYAGNKKSSGKLSLHTRGVALDTDGDGISDAHDLDDDNDGIPDSVELDYGLDSKNKRDGTLDLDADGMSNVKEFLAKTNLFKDSVAPVLTIPANITVVAMGPNAKINIGEATAVDYADGILPVENDAPQFFSAGEYRVNWRVADKQGNQSVATQLISVIPSVYIATAKSVREGGQLEIMFYFHGTAIDYPVVIPYRVSGTATVGKDHDLYDGEIVISTGNKASIILHAIEDYAYDMPEYIDISLGDIKNAAAGKSNSVRIVITE